MSQQVLTSQEAKDHVNRVGPRLGSGDFTYNPVFPETRKDVCAVRRTSEDGHSYGFDTIYLIWKDEVGKIHHKKLTNSRRTKDYIHINSVEADGDRVTVKFGSGGSYSGSPWNNSKQVIV